MKIPQSIKEDPRWQKVSVKQKTRIGKCIQGIEVGDLVSSPGKYNRTIIWSIISKIEITFSRSFTEDADFIKTHGHVETKKVDANVHIEKFVVKVIDLHPTAQIFYGMEKPQTMEVDVWVHGSNPGHLHKTNPYTLVTEKDAP